MTTTADKIRALPDYDTGLLNDHGGGNVEWWQDYLRAEIDRANDHWREQAAALVEAEPPQAVRVKPLMWPDFREGGCVGRPKEVQYFVTQQHNGRFFCHFDESSHDHLADAQAHCDQHYQRAALDLTPTAVDASPASDPVSKTPTLDALAIRTAAIDTAQEIAMGLRDNEYDTEAEGAEDVIAALDALPSPDHAAALAEAMKLPEVKALVDVLTKVPRALNQSFSAGMEEREYGSAKRQAKCLEFVDAVRAEIDAALKGVK